MDKKLFEKIANEFGIKITDIKRSGNAVLAKVFIVNESFILRGIKNEAEAEKRIGVGLRLINSVKIKVSVKFPELKKAKNDKFFVREPDYLWTLYPIIKGRIICSWFDSGKANDNQNKKLFACLRKIHDNTRGIFKKKDLSFSFLKQIKTILNIKNLTSEKNYKRVRDALKIISENNNFSIKNLCFIHGDFHHGNVIYDNKDNIVGIIDLDWCRVGHHLEDLAYAMMMLLRDYREKIFVFDEDKFLKFIDFYGLKNNEVGLLKEYLILYGFFDVYLCSKDTGLPRMKHCCAYHEMFFNYVCKKF